MTEYCNNTEVFHKPKVIREDHEVLIEYCENCKEEQVFTKSRHGRIDNERYRVFHRRDMLQPKDKHFSREYAPNS